MPAILGIQYSCWRYFTYSDESETVELPDALCRKYPNADKEWGWQWVFPASSHYTDRLTGARRRHHLHESVLQRAFKDARIKARIAKPAGCHALRHPSHGGRLRHPHRSGTAGPQRRQHDDDLHPCPQPRRPRRSKPGRPPGPRAAAPVEMTCARITVLY